MAQKSYDVYNGEKFGHQFGRQRIYTDEVVIDRTNVCQVLAEALPIHYQNRVRMKYLIEFEKGDQPLQREKTIREKINIIDIDNVANQIVEFKLGYNWGFPIVYVRSDSESEDKRKYDESVVEEETVRQINADERRRDSAVSTLNAMNIFENSGAKDQELARYVEITGIGHQMVDIKRDYSEGESPFDLITLNPLYTFVVYRHDVKETPALGVTYYEDANGCAHYTCYTATDVYLIDERFEIVNGRPTDKYMEHGKRSGEANPLGRIPIVECDRAYDRMGVFERCIDEMNALNILVSDFCNNVAQNVQQIWWGNDFDFARDPEGNVIKPDDGQWLLTETTERGKTPIVQALSSNFDYDGVQLNIEAKRANILQKCYVPNQIGVGGGSTGVAYSMSSGWAAAESVAGKQENLTRSFKMQIIELELRAIANSHYLPKDHPLMELKAIEVAPKFTRQKTFDLASKVNALATLLKIGIHPRWAMQVVDFFPDVQGAYADSKETLELMQRAMFTMDDGSTTAEETNNGEIPGQDNQTKPRRRRSSSKAQKEFRTGLQDNSMQGRNSPFIGGMGTNNAKKGVDV